MGAVVLRTPETDVGIGGVNRNVRVVLRKRQRVVQTGPGRRSGRDGIGTPSSTVIAYVQSRSVGSKLEGVLIGMQGGSTGDGQPGLPTIQGSRHRDAARGNDIGVGGVRPNHHVVPTLGRAKVRRREFGPALTGVGSLVQSQ